MQTNNELDLMHADSLKKAEEAVKILLENKGLNVTLFDVRGQTSVTDFYVNVTGRSSTNVLALADIVVDKLEERGVKPLHTEGRSGNAWILVDYADVIINVFDKASREFYNFDNHLPKECCVDISPLIAEVDKKYEINLGKKED